MPAIAEPTVDIDLTVLEDIFGDMTPKCDNETCERDATHTITCGQCGVGTEFSCFPCVQSMQAAAAENFLAGTIRFDPQKSCGHITFITLCRIDPL